MPAPLSSQNDYFRGIFLFPVVDPAANEATGGNRGDHLAGRRKKDRERYAAMTDEARDAYNSKRRSQYHKQGKDQRQKRRDRERTRYHSVDDDSRGKRNTRRAEMERNRYKKLTPEDLTERNKKRRERAAAARKARASGQPVAAGKRGRKPRQDHLDKPKSKHTAHHKLTRVERKITADLCTALKELADATKGEKVDTAAITKARTALNNIRVRWNRDVFKKLQDLAKKKDSGIRAKAL